MKSAITIRMGASRFDAIVRVGESIRVYDIRNMNKHQEHDFRRELVKQFRISREALPA